MLVGECGDVPDYVPEKQEPISKSEYAIIVVLGAILAGAAGLTIRSYINMPENPVPRYSNSNPMSDYMRRTITQPTTSLDDFAAEEMRKANEAAR